MPSYKTRITGRFPLNFSYMTRVIKGPVESSSSVEDAHPAFGRETLFTVGNIGAAIRAGHNQVIALQGTWFYVGAHDVEAQEPEGIRAHGTWNLHGERRTIS